MFRVPPSLSLFLQKVVKESGVLPLSVFYQSQTLSGAFISLLRLINLINKVESKFPFCISSTRPTKKQQLKLTEIKVFIFTKRSGAALFSSGGCKQDKCSYSGSSSFKYFSHRHILVIIILHNIDVSRTSKPKVQFSFRVQ